MLESVFQPIADAAGAPVDYIKLFTCLLAAFPLAAVFPYLPSATAKHIYSLTVSLLFFVPVLNLYSGFLQLVGSALLTYAVCTFKIGGKNMGWLVFALQMGHLTYNHAVRKFGAIPLSTIDLRPAEVFRRAVKIICQLLEADSQGPHESLELVPTVITHRSSTLRPPHGD